jgi:hypothetical protein
MDFNYRTDSALVAPTQEPDTALHFVIIIVRMVPFDNPNCFVQPFINARFRSKGSATSVYNHLFSHQSGLIK